MTATLIYCHRYEAGGTAFHSGAQLDTVIPANGQFTDCIPVRHPPMDSHDRTSPHS